MDFCCKEGDEISGNGKSDENQTVLLVSYPLLSKASVRKGIRGPEEIPDEINTRLALLGMFRSENGNQCPIYISIYHNCLP